MKVSGFTIVRNAIKFDYPICECILSILPICDEFIVNVGKSDDGTYELINSIGDSRIKIIQTEWQRSLGGKTFSEQTNIALANCSGDWCFYLHADEVIHEKDLPMIKEKMLLYLNDPEVEGFLFEVIHFWGSYEFYQTAHHWYRREVYIVRNYRNIISWGDAQGFRKINGQKLKVVHSGATVYHYGWIKKAEVMKEKIIEQAKFYHTDDELKRKYPENLIFDYGSQKHLGIFKGTHPKIMEERIKNFSCQLSPDSKTKHKHDKLLIRLWSFIENKILKTRLFEYRNYILLKK